MAADVTQAESAEEAEMLVAEEQPDLVILDWMLPQLNGLQVLESLRVERDSTPVLMLTARDAVEDRVAGLDRGVRPMGA